MKPKWRDASRRAAAWAAALAASVIFSQAALADTAEIIMSGENEYKAVRLTPEIYNRAARGLSDLLVLDAGGSPVPYFINNLEAEEVSEENAVYALTRVNAYVKDGGTYSDFRAETAENTDVVATSISVSTPSEMFAKTAELYGSYDGTVWDFIKADTLYRVDGNEKTDIVFAQPLKYTHYRFAVPGNAGEHAGGTAASLENSELVIEDAELNRSESTVSELFFTETAAPAFETAMDGKDTVIRLFGLKNVKINEMTFETEDMFKREFRCAGGISEELYNLPFGDGGYRDTALGLGGYAEEGDVLEVRVINGDDSSIKISGVSVTYFTDEVIFKADGGGYALSFGGGEAPAPQYDIVNYKDLILAESRDVLALGGVIAALEPEPEPQADYSFAFNIVVAAAAALMGAVIVFRLRR